MGHFRLLLIEDNKQRIEKFRRWLPQNTTLVTATSGGQALGLLKRVERGEYAGIMLDHDLREQIKIAGEFALSGSDMVDIIIQSFKREIAVLVHSQNPGGARSMSERLDQAGFWVTQIPMHLLSSSDFPSGLKMSEKTGWTGREPRPA